MKWQTSDENWETIKSFLPEEWEEKGKELGALRRQRKVRADELLRVLLIHLADGCSLKEAVARAEQGGISKISSVALFKRLRNSSDWFRWMATKLLEKRGVGSKQPDWLSGYKTKSIDASVVSEPGSTGTDWRLHYSLDIFNLSCDHFVVTRPDVGESFTNYDVNKDDLFIGDRMYGTMKGLWHVKKGGGYFLVRLRHKVFSLRLRDSEKEFKLLAHLKKLKTGEVTEWEVDGWAKGYSAMAIRICAIRKSEESAKAAMKRAQSEMKKKQIIIDPEALEMQRYVVLATNLPEEKVSAAQAAYLYRMRWQIEIAFKRLKSIIGLGHLPKVDIESARAWLHGKMFVALLVQAIVDEGRFFSPWGYPLEGI
jgi:transposase